MLRPAERFAVKLQDPIGAARAGAYARRAHAVGPAWMLLPVALVLGLGAAWLVHLGGPFGEPGRMVSEGSFTSRVGMIEPSHGADGATGWFGDLLPAAFTHTQSAGRRAGWPVVLHRAGDGAFYADIRVAGAEVHARIEPGGSAAQMTAADLPTGAVVEDGHWHDVEVELQHLRLPGVTFQIVGDPSETVLGMAGLAAAIEVEETPGRLRIAPTRRQP